MLLVQVCVDCRCCCSSEIKEILGIICLDFTRSPQQQCQDRIFPRNIPEMTSTRSHKVLITAATQLTDKSSPILHPSHFTAIKEDDVTTFTSLFRTLSEQNIFSAISFDTANKTLITIQMTGKDKSDESQELSLAITEFESEVSAYLLYFSVLIAIKFIFRPTTLLSQKVFNCPIHGHIK